MPLLGLTSSQAKLAKWLLRESTVAIPAGLAWLASELAADKEAPPSLEWRRFVLTWNRSTPAGTSEDKAQFKLDLVNVTGDELDTTWTTGDYTSVMNRYVTYITAVIASTASTQVYADLKSYRMRFNPVDDLLRPFSDTGPPSSLVVIGPSAGTGTGVLPYQTAPTVTFRTAWPKHWGRIYLPVPPAAALDATGRFTSSYRSTMQTAVKNLLGGLHDDGFYPVVPVGQLNKVPWHALLGVTGIVMDDVPDVQRRRRPRQVVARTGP